VPRCQLTHVAEHRLVVIVLVYSFYGYFQLGPTCALVLFLGRIAVQSTIDATILLPFVACSVCLFTCLCLCLLVTTYSTANTAEPIEMLFWVWTRGGDKGTRPMYYVGRGRRFTKGSKKYMQLYIGLIYVTSSAASSAGQLTKIF